MCGLQSGLQTGLGRGLVVELRSGPGQVLVRFSLQVKFNSCELDTEVAGICSRDLAVGAAAGPPGGQPHQLEAVSAPPDQRPPRVPAASVLPRLPGADGVISEPPLEPRLGVHRLLDPVLALLGADHVQPHVLQGLGATALLNLLTPTCRKNLTDISIS